MERINMIKYLYRIFKKKFLENINNKLDDLLLKQTKIIKELEEYNEKISTREFQDGKEILSLISELILKLDPTLNQIQKRLDLLDNKTNSILLRQLNIHSSQENRVLFIIHNMYTWAALSLLYYEFEKRDDVEIFVLAINAGDNSSDLQKSYSSKTTDFLSDEKIKYHYIQYDDVAGLISYLSAISPTAIIRQSGWDADIPNIYSAINLSNYNIFYIPYYSLDVINDFSTDKLNLEYNQNLHLLSKKIYGTSQYFVNHAKEIYLGDYKKYEFLGNTKIEFLTKNIIENHHFIKTGVLNVIWAPHHSIGGNWLAFGTFEKNCLDFIHLAEKYGQRIHIKLRAHPLLASAMQNYDRALWEKFIYKWNELPNTSIDEYWDYIKSFEWSDLMISDGISFLAEYPLTNKPIIYIESTSHMEFNENGELARNCCHVVKNSEELFFLIERFFLSELEIKSDAVQKLKESLWIDGAAKRIADDILKTLKNK